MLAMNGRVGKGGYPAMPYETLQLLSQTQVLCHQNAAIAHAIHRIINPSTLYDRSGCSIPRDQRDAERIGFCALQLLTERHGAPNSIPRFDLLLAFRTHFVLS